MINERFGLENYIETLSEIKEFKNLLIYLKDNMLEVLKDTIFRSIFADKNSNYIKVYPMFHNLGVKYEELKDYGSNSITNIEGLISFFNKHQDGLIKERVEFPNHDLSYDYKNLRKETNNDFNINLM